MIFQPEIIYRNKLIIPLQAERLLQRDVRIYAVTCCSVTYYTISKLLVNCSYDAFRCATSFGCTKHTREGKK